MFGLKILLFDNIAPSYPRLQNTKKKSIYIWVTFSTLSLQQPQIYCHRRHNHTVVGPPFHRYITATTAVKSLSQIWDLQYRHDLPPPPVATVPRRVRHTQGRSSHAQKCIEGCFLFNTSSIASVFVVLFCSFVFSCIDRRWVIVTFRSECWFFMGLCELVYNYFLDFVQF